MNACCRYIHRLCNSRHEAEMEALLKNPDSLIFRPTQAVEAWHPVTADFTLHRPWSATDTTQTAAMLKVMHSTHSSNVEGHAHH